MRYLVWAVYTTIKLFNSQVVLILKSAGKQQCNYHNKQWVNDQDYREIGNNSQNLSQKCI